MDTSFTSPDNLIISRHWTTVQHLDNRLFILNHPCFFPAVAKETLEGHQRAIMGSMTVEEIYKDRKTFSKRVFEVASSDLAGMGFIVISYTLKDLSDEEGYLHVRYLVLSNKKFYY